jgi:hypothetical protein
MRKSELIPTYEIGLEPAESTSRNPQADVTAFEAEKDQLIYVLYGLTEDEIAIVEGKSA